MAGKVPDVLPMRSSERGGWSAAHEGIGSRKTIQNGTHDMVQNQPAGKNPRILILGSTGRIGKAVIAELEQVPGSHQAVHASRNRDQVESWRRNGKDAVHLDLDDPTTFPEALKGVDRLFLATGYTIHMVHQSKTIVDAAADSGVGFIVHLGIFGDGRMTDPHFAWHELVERYIEGSGVSWSHLHPHFFMDNLLTTTPVVNGTFHWFMGDKRVGWIAGDDIAAVAARVLAEGPEKHAGKQYWLSTEVLNGAEAAAEIAWGLRQKVECVVMTPDDLAALVASGALRPPPNVEANYAASMLEWARQTYDGRMDFGAVTTPTVEELLGRKPLTLRTWVESNREAVLEAGARAASGAGAPELPRR
jgi:NAD(P)H dehydrogenase (quinone)